MSFTVKGALGNLTHLIKVDILRDEGDRVS